MAAGADAYAAAHPGASVFANWTASETVLEVWGRRSATQIVLGWLSGDLKRLGWTNSTTRPSCAETGVCPVEDACKGRAPAAQCVEVIHGLDPGTEV